MNKEVVIITREQQQQQQEQQQQAMRQVSKSCHFCQTSEEHNRRSARIPLNRFCLSNSRFIASHSWWSNKWWVVKISVGHNLPFRDNLWKQMSAYYPHLIPAAVTCWTWRIWTLFNYYYQGVTLRTAFDGICTQQNIWTHIYIQDIRIPASCLSLWGKKFNQK